MPIDLVDVSCLAPPIAFDGAHRAFTDCCFWRGHWYIAYRAAMAHDVVPPGQIVVLRSADGLSWAEVERWDRASPLLSAGVSDLRDPKFCATPSILYLLAGAYLPRPDRVGLSMHPAENLLWSCYAYTTSGETWFTGGLLGRPQYWLWSVLVDQSLFVGASYHTQEPYGVSSIWLHTSPGQFAGLSPWVPILFEGTPAHNDGRGAPRSTSVSEPVLFALSPSQLACFVRTTRPAGVGPVWIGTGPLLGDHRPWTWHNLGVLAHVSAVLPYGEGSWVVAGRSLTSAPAGRGLTTGVALWQYRPADRAFDLLMDLPGAGDCGYAGLAVDPQHPQTVLMSYYSQHDYTPLGTAYPAMCADVYVARLRVE